MNGKSNDAAAVDGDDVNMRASRIIMTEQEAKEAEAAMKKLAEEDPPADHRRYQGTGIADRFFKEITAALSRGWSWEDILAGMPKSVQSLKAKTLRRYFELVRTQRDAAATKRRGKKDKAVRPDDKSDNAGGVRPGAEGAPEKTNSKPNEGQPPPNSGGEAPSRKYRRNVND